jgi:S-(hydroxymethyl)glutathione dehydrogenase / alcohol dehydrogenase
VIKMEKTHAAILTKINEPLQLVDLHIPALKEGQVLVEVKYSGVCRTQIMEVKGLKGEDKFLPHCLGHEGSGKVITIGSGVTKVKPGDDVILSWMKGNGKDVPGTVYEWDGKKVNAGGITTFSKYTIASENRLTKLPKGVSIKDAAFVGCALATGMGSVMNVLKARHGQSIAVYGAGGIGLFAIAAAKISGCNPIIVFDTNNARLEIAKKMGATHTFISQTPDINLSSLQSMCPKGVDLAVESTGVPIVMKQAFECVRNQGGAAVIIGNAPHGDSLILNPTHFNMGKKLLGTWGGDNYPDEHFPKYLALIETGQIDLSHLHGKTYSLSQINEAISDLEHGRVARPLIDMSLK